MDEIENFVGIYKGCFSKDFCNKVIDVFERLTDLGYGFNRQSGNANKLDKDDLAVNNNVLFDKSYEFNHIPGELHKEFNETFWARCYANYAEKFSVLTSSGTHAIYTNKIQKTNIGQGYHIWHYESDDKSNSGRLLTYVLYLNDVEEGGETEFLYYPKRIKPEAGTLVLFPAAFTHTHRGNPPISNSKYIITGWVEF